MAIRKWVTELESDATELEPDAIRTELLRRQEEFDHALQPHREAIVRAIRLINEKAASLMGGLAAVSRETEQRSARVFLAHVVMDYWRSYPYRPGWRLPPITILFNPWQVPPDTVHIFDLDPKWIHRAVSNSTRLKRLATVSPQGADDLLLNAAGDEIRIFGPLAVFRPLVQVVLNVLLTHVRSADTSQAAAAPAAHVDWLFDQFLDDPSRHIELRADRLAKLRADYRPIHDTAVRLALALEKRERGGIESLAKKLFPPPRGLRDEVLRQWERRPPRDDTIARLAFARQHDLARRTLRRHLDLADKAEEITASWSEFLKLFVTLPEADKRVILGFFPTIVPVPRQGGQGASSGQVTVTPSTPPSNTTPSTSSTTPSTTPSA